MKKFNINAIPYTHPDLEHWRDSLRGGLQYFHQETNLIISGGIDDIWCDREGWLVVVDYKATSKQGKVGLDADWQMGYKRQMEIYQWLLRRMGHRVSDTGYFVYCNGDSSAPKFEKRLEFEIDILAYSGNDAWIEDCLYEIKRVLNQNIVPPPSEACDHCAYTRAITKNIEKTSKISERLI